MTLHPEIWHLVGGAVVFLTPLALALRKLILARIELARVKTEAAIKVASTQGAAVAEIAGIKAEASGRYVTPVAKQAMAREAAAAKLAADPSVDEKKIGDDTLTFHIEQSHAALKETVRTSQLPPSDGTPPPAIPPRSKTGYSGSAFPAVVVPDEDDEASE